MEAKRIIVFDLDGTLTESKSRLDDEMAVLLEGLLDRKKVAVISGGSYRQFEKQFIKNIGGKLENLFLFPTCATQFYRFENDSFVKVYEDRLKADDKKRIMESFERVLDEIGYEKPKKTYGEVIEDRGTQITFSALGQNAPLEEKVMFDPDNRIREKIRKNLARYLPDFEIKLGGTTSIDITRKGIDKAYGIRKIQEYLGIGKEEILFVGDALYAGGNDHAVLREGVQCIGVRNHDECKGLIRTWLNGKD